MICPKCGNNNPDNAKFCMGCGEKLDCAEKQKPTIFCPSCGALNFANDEYCVNCLETLKPNKRIEEKYTEPKNVIGLLMGIFLGFLGLLIGVVLYPFGSNSRDTFVKSWTIGFVSSIAIGAVLGLIIGVAMSSAHVNL